MERKKSIAIAWLFAVLILAFSIFVTATNNTTNIVEMIFDSIELQENSSVVNNSHTKLVADLFTDSDGYAGTINTGSTTSYFRTASEQYESKPSQTNTISAVSEPGFETVTGWTATTSGTANPQSNQSSTQAHSGTYSWRLYQNGTASGISIANVLRSVDFTNVNYVRFWYKVTTSITGNANVKAYAGSTLLFTFPTSTGDWAQTDFLDVRAITGSQDLKFEFWSDSGPSVTGEVYIDDITAYSWEDGDIITNSLSSGETKKINQAQVYLPDKTIPSDSTLTVDVSSDGGSTYTNNISLNQIVNLTSTLGSDLRLRFNLNPNTSKDQTPTLKNYSIKYLTTDQLEGLLYANTSDSSAIANTTTETNFDTSYTLPADALTTGKVLKIKAQGKYSSTATPNLNLRIKYGSTTLVQSGSVNVVNTASNQGWLVEGTIIARTTGSTGTAMATGYFHNGRNNNMPLTNAGATTIDTTTANTLQVSAQWNTASPSNTITLENITIEALN
ncbi:MAG: hypothetical protein HY392_03650 [Candidatus Diapherotrites archaeon]|nr:hypothetical protein [Candidatus Diapherotrites archaeon]